MIPVETKRPVVRHSKGKEHMPKVKGIMLAFTRALTAYGGKPKSENPIWTDPRVTLHRERLYKRMQERLEAADPKSASDHLKIAYTAMQLWFDACPPEIKDKIRGGTLF